MQERLQKVLSKYGIASRRKAEEFILNKKILINNKTAKLGDKVDLEKDEVLINNKKLIINKDTDNFVYYLVNKPLDYVCSFSDKYAKNLVIDLIPKKPKVWPVGRLDKNSTGLIILTNDGELTNKLTHPKFNHKKE